MKSKNINIKIIAGIVAFMICFSNFGLLSNGIMKVLAEDEIIDNIKLEPEFEVTKYVQYNKESYKGVLLETRLNIVQDVEESNYIPTLESRVKIQVPSIEGKLPMADVVAISTAATNGESGNDINFDENNWSYDKDSGLLSITYKNENNYNKYEKGAMDSFYLIYTYPEESYTGYDKEENVVLKANIEKVFKNNKSELTSQKEITEQVILKDKKSDIISYNVEKTTDIYKGYIYANKQTEYTSYEYIEVSNKDLINDIEITKTKDSLKIGNEEKDANTKYKRTTISKNNFDKIIGKNGALEIYANDMLISKLKYENDNLVKETNNGQKETITSDSIVIEYGENVQELKIKISNPIKTGIIEFINEKIILPSEEIKKVNSINDRAVVLGNKKDIQEQNEIINQLSNSEFNYGIELKETINEVEVELKDINGNDNGTISTLNDNILTYTATLRNDSFKYNLLENPIVTIKFPKEITYIKAQDINIVQGNGIKLDKSSSARNEDGSSYIKIQLTGNQTEYTNSITEGLKLTMTLTLRTSNTIPSKETSIETTVENKNTVGKHNTNIKIASKEGILMLTTYDGYNSSNEKITITDSTLKNSLIANNSEERNITQKIYVINNYNEDMKNIELIGNLNYSNQEEKSSFNTKLKEFMNLEGATIQYRADDEKWLNEDEIKDLNTIKEYKIFIPVIGKQSSVEISTKLLIEANLDLNEQTFINNSIKYIVLDEQKEQSSTVGFFTAKISDSKEEIKDDVKQDSTQTENNKINATMKATIGGQLVKEDDQINKGQIVRYYVVLQNSTTEDATITVKTKIENAQYYEARDINIEYTKDKFATEYSLAPEDDLERTNQIKIKAGETAVYDYQVRVKENADNVVTLNNIAYGQNSQELKLQNKTKDAKIAIETKYAYNEEKRVASGGDKLPVIVKVSNLTNKNIKNVNVEVNIPEELENNLELMKEITLGDNLIPYENGKVKIENNKLIWNVDEIEANKEQELYISFITKKLDKTIAQKDISILANAKIKNEEYISNDLIKTINQVNDNLNSTVKTNIKDGSVLKNGDEIIFTIDMKNEGALNLENIRINSLPDEGIDFVSANSSKYTYKIDNPEVLEINNINLKQGESERITIKAQINVNKAIASNEELNCNFSIETDYNTNKLFTSFKVDNPTNEKDYTYDADENPNDMDSEDPSQPRNSVYSIEGVAWFDENKNGARDDDEKLLEKIKVTLVNADNKQIVKDNNGKEMSKETDENGKYKFEDLKEGNYIVVFEFDNKTYSVTTYKKENVEEGINSDVVSSNVQIDGTNKIAAITDILKLQKDLQNIDIGLIQNAKFDLKLDKYISKVIIKNLQGTETKNYENTNFAKVDLTAKYINSASIIITYKFVVTNNGDVTGYVDKLVDNLPAGLEFSSELNKEWYQAADGTLNTSSSGIAIEPGKTSEIELILTKQMNEENTGKVTNTASLTKISNLEGIEEEAERVTDNSSSADILLSIKTGSPIMYISITLISIGIIAIGAYLVKKKVLNKVL